MKRKHQHNLQTPDGRLIQIATKAIRTNRFQRFKKAFTQSPRELSQTQNNRGCTLLQEAIHQNNERIFNYMLQFDVDLDAVNSKNETALAYVVSEKGDQGFYYLAELIRKGASLQCIHSAQLLACVDNSAINSLKLLLEKGVDVNSRDENECTALYRVLLNKSVTNRDEFIATLLYYNIDAAIQPTNLIYNAFESAVQSSDLSIHEVLFYYMYDQYRDCEIDFSVLLQLAELKSPLLHTIFDNDTRINLHLNSTNFRRYFSTLCSIDVVYLQILLQKCQSYVCEITKRLDVYTWDTPKKYKLLTTANALTKLGLLLESSDHMTSYMMDYIHAMNCDTVLIYVSFFDEAITTKLIIYMVSYGLEINRDFLDRIYELYGYSDLFKFLLHVDYKGKDTSRPKNVLVSLIVDKDVDIDMVLEKRGEYSLSGVSELFHYVAHPKLHEFVLENPRNWLLSATKIRALMKYPKVPLLVDMARNACRKHIWKSFSVQSTKQFYNIVNGLPIALGYKKIITFEKKLY